MTVHSACSMLDWDMKGRNAIDVSALPPSVIPQQYHVVSVRLLLAALVPNHDTDWHKPCSQPRVLVHQQESLFAPTTKQARDEVGWEYNKDKQIWTRTEFPSLAPTSRREVVLLAEWLDNMIDNINPEDAPLEVVQRAQAVYSACFHEIVRQVRPCDTAVPARQPHVARLHRSRYSVQNGGSS